LKHYTPGRGKIVPHYTTGWEIIAKTILKKSEVESAISFNF